MNTLREKAPIHHQGEFHSYIVNHGDEVDRTVLVAERIADYTLNNLPWQCVIYEGELSNVYVQHTGTKTYFPASSFEDTTEVELIPRYTLQNTAIYSNISTLQLIRLDAEGNLIATLAQYDRDTYTVTTEVEDISSDYAELLIQFHNNFGSENENIFHGLGKQATDAPWGFKVDYDSRSK